MKITGLSHLLKWDNLHKWWLTKYFFAPLYIYIMYKDTYRAHSNWNQSQNECISPVFAQILYLDMTSDRKHGTFQNSDWDFKLMTELLIKGSAISLSCKRNIADHDYRGGESWRVCVFARTLVAMCVWKRGNIVQIKLIVHQLHPETRSQLFEREGWCAHWCVHSYEPGQTLWKPHCVYVT
jgi:hypothetical protein